MYWNILVWLRIKIPDGFFHQISENLKIDDLVTGGTINLQLTLQDAGAALGTRTEQWLSPAAPLRTAALCLSILTPH